MRLTALVGRCRCRAALRAVGSWFRRVRSSQNSIERRLSLSGPPSEKLFALGVRGGALADNHAGEKRRQGVGRSLGEPGLELGLGGDLGHLRREGLAWKGIDGEPRRLAEPMGRTSRR